MVVRVNPLDRQGVACEPQSIMLKRRTSEKSAWRWPEGGISGILDTQRAEQGQPQEPQRSDPSGEAGPTGPACAFRMKKAALGRPFRKGWVGCSRGGVPKENPRALSCRLMRKGKEILSVEKRPNQFLTVLRQ